MISVPEALQRVSELCTPLPVARRALAECLSGVLAKDLAGDLDSPPYHKSLVDGYAVRSRDSAPVRKVIETVMAGQVPRHAVTPNAAIRLMTGAPIPEGADAVVMLERITPEGDEAVRLHETTVNSGQNILPRGTSFKKGEVLLQAGKRLRPADVGLLAEAGHGVVPIVAPPHVAVLATGDELVQCHHTPGPGQIRNSNGPLLVAALQSAAAVPVDLGIARDHLQTLRMAIRHGLQQPVLLLSGGVSAGDLDLVPSVLSELGVEQVFHKVRLKPGKPLWFGKLDDDQGRHLVFGLPGNPVSNFVCFEIFVRPALLALAGLGFQGHPLIASRLSSGNASWQGGGDRQTYFPARFVTEGAGEAVEPLAWHGSADLATVSRAEALLVLDPGETELKAGDAVRAIDLRDRAWAAGSAP